MVGEGGQLIDTKSETHYSVLCIEDTYRLRFKMDDRVCPVCGVTFTPKHKRQIYHSDYCRVKASRERRKGLEAPLDATGLLDEIRKVDAEIAHDIEDVAKRAGLAFAEEILLICYRAMNRAGYRYAKQVLIEAGEIKPVKRKKSAKQSPVK